LLSLVVFGHGDRCSDPPAPQFLPARLRLTGFAAISAPTDSSVALRPDDPIPPSSPSPSPPPSSPRSLPRSSPPRALGKELCLPRSSGSQSFHSIPLSQPPFRFSDEFLPPFSFVSRSIDRNFLSLSSRKGKRMEREEREGKSRQLIPRFVSIFSGPKLERFGKYI